MALFVCLRELALRHGFIVRAIHVNHGIRGAESDRDEEFVRALCERENVPLYVRRTDVPALARAAKTGLEAAARSVRRQFFDELHAAGKVDAVATAHHMDDNAETLLLHMIRGAGLAGLAGMQPRQGNLIRPFLCLHRQQIREYLDRGGHAWVEDSTNEDVNYRRNFVRHELMPLAEQINPQAVDALGRLAASCTRDQEYLMQAAAQAAQAAVVYREEEAEIALGALISAPEAISARMLRIVLAKLGKPLDVEHAHIEALLQLSRSGRTGASLDLGGGWQAQVSYGSLLLGRRQPAVEEYEREINLDGETELPGGIVLAVPAAGRGAGSGWSEFLDRDLIPPGAVFRPRRPGDTFRPLGSPGAKKLKDYFIDIKLPRRRRDQVPLLADGPRILWIAGLRLSQDVAVGERTKRIVHLTYAERTNGSEAALR